MKREKSGYKNFDDYLETMKAYRFSPHFKNKEDWEKRYISKDEQKREQFINDHFQVIHIEDSK